MAAMLTLEEAQARLIALVEPASIETISAENISGIRHLASDLCALRTQPPADLSAMDGYAICGEGPWKRIGESRAGAPFNGDLNGGECTRISTGAHMPEGSDRVLIQENAQVDGDVVTATDMPVVQRHVRKRGFDFCDGDVVLKQGTLMGPAQIALAIASGHGTIPAFAAPKIAILDSGDELARDPSQCGPDQIPASNGAMIASMLRPYVGETARLGPVPDDHAALATALDQANDADMLITSGGASVGDHDLIQQALESWGADLAFWKVAIKPGKPLMVATREVGGKKRIILGLPGNPVSSFVTCFLFALPLVRAAMGDATPLPRAQQLVAGEDLPAIGSRHEFLRGVSDGVSVKRAASQDSSALLALASANCLIDRNPNAAAVCSGDLVSVYNLQNG